MLPGAAASASWQTATMDHRVLPQGTGNGPLESANMLWLIQRDFLQGKSVQAMVAEALQPVANPGHDPDIEQVPRTPAECLCGLAWMLSRPCRHARTGWPGAAWCT